MHLKARLDCFIGDRETIRLILRSLDPERIEMRASHKLYRRLLKELNELWQIDDD